MAQQSQFIQAPAHQIRVTPEELAYPVLLIRGSYFELRRSPDELSTDYLSAIRAGKYEASTVVDAGGRAYHLMASLGEVSFAARLLNPLVGQRVRCTLSLSPAGAPWSLDQIRGQILREFTAWGGWESREDANRVRAAIEAAPTTSALLTVLQGALFRAPQDSQA